VLSPVFSRGGLSTCRFNTRIDYIYVDGGSVSDGVSTVVDYYHVTDSASDHDMVVADLEFKYCKSKKGGRED
jgi:endonuclease/exonuclease/phosphatase family metal-dependent hydrolase